MILGAKGVYLAIFLSGCSWLLSACEETPTHKHEILGPPSSRDAVVEDSEEKGEDSPSTPTPAAPGPAAALNGKQLYSDLCVSCHGSLEQAEHAGENAQAIKNAISTVPDMSGLKDLSDAKIAVIGGELAKVVPPAGGGAVPPAGGGVALDGMKLYMDNCMGCHGPKPNTTVDVKTVDAVKAARVNIPDMAGNATPDAELMALLKYLIDP